jgi:cytochrome c peroxidase
MILTCRIDFTMRAGMCAPPSCWSLVLVLVCACSLTPEEELSLSRKVGRALFMDDRLSEPAGQSCATCHDPARAFTDPRSTLFPTSPGADVRHFGVRSAPSVSYAAFSPAFQYVADDDTYQGGQFWDGRADTLEAQAKAPFLNPLEMANPDAAAVVAKVRAADYAPLFRRRFGDAVFDDVDRAYGAIATAIADFERGPEVSPFSSKYDAFLRGEAELTEAEARGLALFNDPRKGNCAACHPSEPSPDGTPPLFTDFTYDNLGIPRNPENPFYALPPDLNPDGAGYVDLGLGGPLKDPAQNGRFKVSTLRNVAVTAPYGHNGYFGDLRSVVDFYDTRDVKAWPRPEVEETVNHDELGDLGLTDPEVNDLVTFLGVLTDGYSRP